MRSLGVLTISTSGFHGAREDTSGRAISELLSTPDYQQVRYEVVPDDKDMIADRVTSWSDSGEVEPHRYHRRHRAESPGRDP